MKRRYVMLNLFLAGCSLTAIGQGDTKPQLVQAILTEPGATPFHLQAIITERADPDERVDLEMFWAGPDKWRRTIRSQEFSQVLVVNGAQISEEDSGDYIPLGIETLVTAMVDPRRVLNAVRPGDVVRTKADGAVDESGRTCFDRNRKLCMVTPFGLSEFVGAPGHSVEFTDYQKFKGKRVARRLIYHIDAGDSLLARVTTLGEFESRDPSQFAVAQPTPASREIHTAIFSEAELRSQALQPLEIVWPQVLEDGNTSGDTSYYISTDRSGKVREVLPLSVSVERANDSARRQIMRWKFQPALKDGVPVQAEAVFNFHFDTRAYGPAAPLTDPEVRALASNTVDPVFPSGSTPGATCKVRFAVDSEGTVIESMSGGAPPELSATCMQALGKWRFSPIMIDGQPRPYRAELTFRVP